MIGVSGKARMLAEVPEQPSGLGWLPDGSLLIVSMRDRLLLRENQEPFADLRHLAPGYLIAPIEALDSVPAGSKSRFPARACPKQPQL